MTVRAATFKEICEISRAIGYANTVDARGIISASGAAAIYDHWTHNSVNIHIYSPQPKALFESAFVRAVFSYPFKDCKLGLLIGITPADHKDSLVVSKAFGFIEKYRIKDGWKVGVDLVVKEMTKTECPWLLEEAA